MLNPTPIPPTRRAWERTGKGTQGKHTRGCWIFVDLSSFDSGIVALSDSGAAGRNSGMHLPRSGTTSGAAAKSEPSANPIMIGTALGTIIRGQSPWQS